MNLATKSRSHADSEAAAPGSSREHLVTVLLGLWMTIGLFLDGYFHQNLESEGESFLTPWHAVFYSGFAAMALWLGRMAHRRGRTVDWRLASLPPGYAGARVGLALFAAGGLGDAVWHSVFGVERGIDALLSPTHLLLFAGLLLLLTSPVRAARATPWAPPGPWMVAGSVISAAALVGFFVNFAWGLGIAGLTRVAYDPITDGGETAVIAGVASTLVTTAVLFFATRLLLASAPPPPGAIAVLFATVALLVSAAFDEDAEGVVAAVVAGVLLEFLVRVGGMQARWLPARFAAAAMTLWIAYFGLLSGLDGVEWQIEIWLGTAVLNAAAAVGIGFVQLPGARARTTGGVR